MDTCHHPYLSRLTKKEKNLSLPDDTLHDVRHYMLNNLWGSEAIVSLWNQSPRTNVKAPHLRFSGLVGDVGRFHSDGHFDVLFNIFHTFEENQMRNCRPPPGFVKFKCTSMEKFVTFLPASGTTRIGGFSLIETEPEASSVTSICSHFVTCN